MDPLADCEDAQMHHDMWSMACLRHKSAGVHMDRAYRALQDQLAAPFWWKCCRRSG